MPHCSGAAEWNVVFRSSVVDDGWWDDGGPPELEISQRATLYAQSHFALCWQGPTNLAPKFYPTWHCPTRTFFLSRRVEKEHLAFRVHTVGCTDLPGSIFHSLQWLTTLQLAQGSQNPPKLYHFCHLQWLTTIPTIPKSSELSNITSLYHFCGLQWLTTIPLIPKSFQMSNITSLYHFLGLTMDNNYPNHPKIIPNVQYHPFIPCLWLALDNNYPNHTKIILISQHHHIIFFVWLTMAYNYPNHSNWYCASLFWPHRPHRFCFYGSTRWSWGNRPEDPGASQLGSWNWDLHEPTWRRCQQLVIDVILNW